MKLFYLPGAVCAQKALLTVVMKKVDVETIALSREDLVNPEYLLLNPKGVVPTLVDDADNIIVESSTIMRFVDESFPGISLQPEVPYLRAVMNNWMKVMDEDLFPAIGCFTMATLLKVMFDRLTDEELLERMERIAGPAVGAMRFDAVRHGVESRAVNGAISTWRKHLCAMNVDLEGRSWLAGEKISLGDIALVPAFIRLADLGLSPWWQDEFPNVERWWKAVTNLEPIKAFSVDFPNPMASGLYASGDRLRQKIL
ncbi:glutathione S-transferase family protein [Novosphingobium terrae]|uniref:glutathione S-transferase family protein n=1 Tax=Novosphingobium terrae TaxID=2726189 RepID=UPI00197DBF0F|nr:glutathione S-transferase family protein [Novosphingobium terrae]